MFILTKTVPKLFQNAFINQNCWKILTLTKLLQNSYVIQTVRKSLYYPKRFDKFQFKASKLFQK